MLTAGEEERLLLDEEYWLSREEDLLDRRRYDEYDKELTDRLLLLLLLLHDELDDREQTETRLYGTGLFLALKTKFHAFLSKKVNPIEIEHPIPKNNQDEYHLTWPTQSILVAKKVGKIYQQSSSKWVK